MKYFSLNISYLSLAELYECMHITGSPVFAGKAHTRPAASRLETLFGRASQGATGGSHGGGGLLGVGGTIHGESTLEVLVLPSLITERESMFIIACDQDKFYCKHEEFSDTTMFSKSLLEKKN